MSKIDWKRKEDKNNATEKDRRKKKFRDFWTKTIEVIFQNKLQCNNDFSSPNACRPEIGSFSIGDGDCSENVSF